MSVDQELFGDRLPTYLTRFIGRQRELTELRELCRDAALITICGVGGLGKTRLAIELARSLRSDPGPEGPFDEVVWVPLIAVTDGEAVAAAAAAGLGLAVPSGRQAVVAVSNVLRGRRALLVLDNCEQVAAAVADLAYTLQSDGIEALLVATSRIPLECPGERVYAVPPMSADALELFVDRARTVAPAYALTERNAESIAQICERLAGLPLAVELMASWTRTVSPLDLLAHMDEASNPPSVDGLVADRHRDLDAVLQNTWGWLSDDDRTVATALAVFRGGFTREAAEQVAGATLASLATLTERAIIQRLPDARGGTRYQLHELVRTFAVHRLEATDEEAADALRARHFDYFLAMAEAMDTPEHTLQEPTLDSPTAAERANLDVAMTWAMDRGDAERALRIVDALHAFYPYSQPLNADRIAHLTRALALPWNGAGRIAAIVRGKALNRLAYVYLDGDPVQARSMFQRASELFSELPDPVGLANSLRGFAMSAFAAGDLNEFARHNDRARRLAREIGDELGEAWTLHGEVAAAGVRGDVPRAVRMAEGALAIFERNGGLYGMYRTWFRLAEAYRRNRAWHEAIQAYRAAFEIVRTQHFTTETGDLLEGLGHVAAALRDGASAARLIGAARTWRAVYDEHSRIWWPSGQEAVHIVHREIRNERWEDVVGEGARLTADQAVELAHTVMDDLTDLLQRHQAGLTEREVDILRLVADGLSNQSIAKRLVLSPRTVHAHLRSIFTKLGVTSRTAAAHEAVRLHLA